MEVDGHPSVGRIVSVRPITADADETASALRTVVVASALALILAAGLTGSTLPDASSAATTALGQTLFGLNAPSLDELDKAESALRSRAAIVGTFADWAHAPEFPREVVDAINERGAVALISWEPWDSWRGGADQPQYALAGSWPAITTR